METSSTNKKTLAILNYLLENKASKEELLARFSVKNSTLYRHLNLIKKAGFELKQEDLIYSIDICKNLITFADYEISLFSYLLLIADIMLPKKKCEFFKNAINKALALTNNKDRSKVKTKYEDSKLASMSNYYAEKISTLKKYKDSKNYVSILTKNNETMNILPVNFIWEKNKLFLEFLDKEKKSKKIPMDDVVKVLETENKIFLFDTKETIFELHGKLAKSYLLKEDERIIDFTKDKIVIANHSKDKEALFKRLLRYDTLCKITFPKTDVVYFNNMIEKSLANIDGFLDNI